MSSNLKPLDSAGGFSVADATLIDNNKNIKNVNSLELQNSFFSDSKISQYILRGTNTSILALDNSGSQIILPSNTINFVTARIIAVNESGGGQLSQKIESAIDVSSSGVLTELSSMTTIIKSSVPSAETWDIVPFTSGSANRFSYSASRSGSTVTVKWVVFAEVVSISWA